MFYYWGTRNGEGVDDVTEEKTTHDHSVIKISCPKSTIQDKPIGRCLGFIGENGHVSVLQYGDGQGNDAVMQNFNLKKDHIKLMKSGTAGAVLRKSDGEILFMETWNSCRLFKVLCDRQVTQVACGNQHCIAIIRDGQLLVWGANSHGQLGLEKSSLLEKEECRIQSPQPLKSLYGIPVVQISAGGDHSFALSLSGAVFGWGKNNAGQLGLGNTTSRHTPTCVKSLNMKKTIFISCGEEHTAILTKGGYVFTFGSGSCGQLGHGSLRNEHHPRLVAELMGAKVSQIACGGHHTLALSESFNMIYSFGCGKQGQLGNGTMVNQAVPLPVHLPPDHSPALKVKRVLAAGNTSIAQVCQNHETSVISHVCTTIDDQMIDRWLKEYDTNACRQTKREIRRIFSSPSCVNGSFIDESRDKHFLTSVEYSGLDLSLARLAFEKIATKTKVLLEVQHTVERELLQALSVCRAEVEALRVYLILPELIRVLQEGHQKTQLAVYLADAIEKLGPCDALEKLWTRMPFSYFRTLVKIFHSESTRLVTQMTTQPCDHWESLTTMLSVLKRLFLVNRRRKCALMESQFCITEVADLLGNSNIEKLVPYSFVADTETKKNIFIVEFIGENGVDFRGLSAEFLSLLSEAFITWQKKPLQVFEDSQLVWFNPNIADITDFYYLGLVCGMALYNCHFTNINFPLALFKKLLCLSPNLHDLEELTPVEARSLKNLLAEDEDVVDELYLDFMVKDQELISNGAQTPVTKFNRQKYVDLYVDFIFNKSVKNQFEQFSAGFSEGCPINAWKIFHPEELREVVYGSPLYKWEDLQKGATYEHCSPSDELIQNFWTVFFEFSEEQRKTFLFFMYGTDRVPAGGLSKVTLKIMQLNSPDSDDRFPEAQTCFGTLYLPKYSDIDTLRNKLIHAISFCEVFGRA
ncbi:hypothetical protein IRJ41_006650 [Triplophysa rosa]|uniref:HECT domain-containing protein n=1 Tax=Triplophysa rosa TaxID=992332 RepID=A0A9W7WZ89_TRIRA|nr:hypothetical protein IRJ41_006650 [Triplophysa rosa]